MHLGFPFKIRKVCCLKVACHKLTCWARNQEEMVCPVTLWGLISIGTSPQVSFYPAKCFNLRLENHWGFYFSHCFVYSVHFSPPLLVNTPSPVRPPLEEGDINWNLLHYRVESLSMCSNLWAGEQASSCRSVWERGRTNSSFFQGDSSWRQIYKACLERTPKQ